jgi:GNAT superfamily N-acetyltransferase
MYELIEIGSHDDRQRFCCAPGLPALQYALAERHRPDAQWAVADAHGNLVARCSLWWKAVPPHAEHRLGFIGHYAARDDAAASMLRLATEQLAGHGCTLAVGPIDGNTWQNYRFITDRGNEPAFFLEPGNPDEYPVHFTNAGFTPLARYYSALNADLGQDDPEADAIAARLAVEGVTVRPLRSACLEDELRRLHALSLECFRDNFLFTPISAEDFLAQYLPLKPYVRPELILVAEQAGMMVGYVFAVPDLLQAKRGQAIDTFIIKTLAAHPAWRGSGVGRLLAARCHQAARRLGMRRAIHALMEETSRARTISGPIATTMRRYTLFARNLEIGG